MLDLCPNDSAFGPGSECRELDFTLRFQQTILSILPNAVFILLAALRLGFLRHKPCRLDRPFDALIAVKAVLCSLLVASSAAVLAKLSNVTGLPDTTLAAHALALVASIFLLASCVAEHYLSVAPSTLNIFYSLVFGLFGSAELRTLAAIGLQAEASAAFIARAVAVAALFAVLLLETVEKRSLLKQPYLLAPRVSTSSFVIKPFFFHLFPLLWTGRKRRLAVEDLGTIPPHLRATPTRKKLESAIASRPLEGAFLFRATVRAFGREFCSPIIPRVVLLLATFAQVFLVEDLTRFISTPDAPSERGWSIVGGYAIIYVGISLSTYLLWEKVFNVTVQYRAALVGTIYHKTLRLTSVAAREVGQGAATTFMSVDVEKICMVLEFVHEIWASVVAIILACVLLWFKASYAMLAPLVMMALIFLGTGLLGGPVGRSQTAWMKGVDARIKLLSSIFSQMLPIKLGAYEVALQERVRRLRVTETLALRKFYLLIMSAATLSNVGATFSGLACLGAYAILIAVGHDIGPFDVSRIFTILTIIQLLNGPINIIGQTLPDVFAAYASMQRIQTFLALAEKASAPLALDPSHDDALDPLSSDEDKLALEDLDPSVVKVAIVGGSFGWDADLTVLHEISLQLQPGKLHMVVGTVGSGKTTLLMSLLGETVLQKGTLDVQARKIALATQTAFIYPGTLRANILLDQPYEEAFFAEVISACGLRPDVDRLPKGDQTMLGERGISLSGGQRQRLALARAVYARADVVLLDDTFSALDGETEAQVFSALFGPRGMLKGKTCVLITHGIQHLPSSDVVVVLEAGRITHCGSFEVVREQGAKFALAARIGTHHEATDAAVDATEASSEEEKPEAEDEDDEMKWEAKKSERWAGYNLFAKATSFASLLLLLFLIFLTMASSLGLQGYLKEFATSTGNIGKWMGGYAAFCFAYLIAQTFTLAYFSVVVTARASRRIHAAELSGLMASPPSYFQRNAVGKILNRFSADITQLDFFFPLAILNLVYCLFHVLGVLIFLILATPWLGISIPVLGPVYWFTMRLYLGTSKQLQRLEAGSKSPLYTLFSTTVGGLTSIRAFGAQDFFAATNTKILDHSQLPYHYRFEGMNFLRTFLTWISAILAIGMASLAVALRASTSAALLGVALSQLVSLSTTLMFAMMAWAQAENALVSVERINEIVKLPAEDPAPLPYDRSSKAGSLWPSSGRLQMVDYSMRYKQELPLALKNLNFDLAGGMKLGICGRSGSGKSSMLLALFRAVDADLASGKILIDSVDINDVSLEQLRDSMSIVTQDPFLWHGSVRENLDVDQARSDAQIWHALRSVEMADVVSALPEKLESIIVDEEQFSKGQRQLLCLARALLRQRKIVVLDESTSSMDHLTDEKIRNVVDKQLKGFTIVSIAHRISSLLSFDRILLLDGGEVLEFGGPDDLLADRNSRFARLAATQGIRHPGRAPEASVVVPPVEEEDLIEEISLAS